MSRAQKKKILIASGVNLDLLGRRQPEIYGEESLEDMKKMVQANWKHFFSELGYRLVFFQTNDEAKFLQELGKGYVAAVINAGAWTHTSLAIADRLIGLSLPFVETHISKVSKREAFRQHSYLAPYALKVVEGHGIKSYWIALEYLIKKLK